MNANTTVLAEISFQLVHGNPWWGLALCNRYFASNHPLRPALINSFRTRIGDSAAKSPLAEALISGRLDTEHEHLWRHQIGARGQRTTHSAITPRIRTNNRFRLAPRERRNERLTQPFTHPIRVGRERGVGDTALLSL